jgi:isopenicillin N synthase-like dioxygenase
MAPSRAALQTVSAADLCARDGEAAARVRTALADAFGPGGLGILAVGGLADWYASARAALLGSARAFAALPPARRARYECADADYAVGWSCGRERFRGEVDTMKGSYYGNPCFDAPAGGGGGERARRFKHLLAPNVWPRGEPGVAMEEPFKRVGRYVDALGKELAWHCDRHVASVANAPFTKLHDALESSRAQKGRLLHYYPPPEPSDAPSRAGGSLWCSFHNDHGALTGLVAGEFYSGRTSKVLAAPPDPDAGLYVAPCGAGGPVRVAFPADCVAFQTGEAAQILSGGVLCATAHAVRSVSGGGGEGRDRISRSSMAVFLQPDPEEVLLLPPWDADGRAALVTSDRVPPLADRYEDGDTFAAFGGKTIQAYVVGGGDEAA